MNKEFLKNLKSIIVKRDSRVDFTKYATEKEFIENVTIEELKVFEIKLLEALRFQKVFLDIYIDAENDGFDAVKSIFKTQEMIKKIKLNLPILKEVIVLKQLSD